MGVDLAILLILGVVLSWFIPAICHPWNNPPPIPSFPQHRVEVIDLIDGLSIVTPSIVELGAGWGGLTRRLAARGFVTGIEKSHSLAWWLRCSLWGTGVRVLRGDVLGCKAWEAYQRADVAVMYLSPGLNAAVLGLFPPGVYVVSICFECPGLELIAERPTAAGTVFLYRS